MSLFSKTPLTPEDILHKKGISIDNSLTVLYLDQEEYDLNKVISEIHKTEDLYMIDRDFRQPKEDIDLFVFINSQTDSDIEYKILNAVYSFGPDYSSDIYDSFMKTVHNSPIFKRVFLCRVNEKLTRVVSFMRFTGKWEDPSETE